MIVDVYFSGKNALDKALQLSRVVGVPYDTPDAGVIAIFSVDLDKIPSEFRNPLLRTIDIRESERGTPLKELYHA